MRVSKTPRVARNVVLGCAYAAMLFIVLIGLFSNALLTSNVFLLLLFAGWVPAEAMVEYLARRSGTTSSRRSARARIAVVLGSTVAAATASAAVVPLVAYPLVPAVWIVVILLGFLPTSVLALVRIFRNQREGEADRHEG
ncbi:hypothetical protein [Curtobacterium sp. ISL-83]|uniref:hypothetical protein n=1 Tax=Curtobacterium sp. ISL-83 TaxID=2819145 RepID=UPI001BEC1CE1|nr:hypothetical protein [Curtobacterium sp. ISL-83]MBT2503881.1 hypothetical protein [Curtobacterium sp. ISL-83]